MRDEGRESIVQVLGPESEDFRVVEPMATASVLHVVK